ncbi:adenylate/guanylate cyclase domain-containing protein [Phaeobacter gallaeciensis]|uniref:adenylate/guanylate cyclase domain-containing protein n=1 Tax=Phaeobacter gallaeciensis TaxID=60890 RepID=UPI00237F70E9|nr:adenylate/guanylate cyclase domain-containing protein [Phaeobacter gallaeciensis]MDE4100065.1 adenylate/guanylate cyclase domain-containing protein [Phaeobacter gallaeciensis]MDE4108894.1 adenylate/guanylate cyclase domain-containing protein [Phaeobacter gallaeciensis]MDE4113340.1 adenylate/guanylate cyclase domain-containing protein [Phaeobacter gallaeciensis]MDE4117754.1 adenylate/guanylate cyclase domain-containing protein [Phaeobacter gallaeciensis]MDE4122257.1 adenylate/guanylate cycla
MPASRTPFGQSTPETAKQQPAALAVTQIDGTENRVILFADMEGYSRRVDENEAEALEFMARCFNTFRVLAKRHEGQIVKTMGDGVLVLFDEALLAIEFATEFHQIVGVMHLGQTDPPLFRIGIHRGEVLMRGGDPFGHAVNVAARLQTLAAPGGTVVSHEVYTTVSDAPRFTFQSRGRQPLKNIRSRTSIYEVRSVDVAASQTAPRPRLRVDTVGGIVLHGSNGDMVGPRGSHAVAILGYLALSPEKTELRDRLAALLWPDHTSAAARKALGACVQRLERSLAPTLGSFFQITPSTLGFDQMQVESDIDIILADIRVGRVPSGLRAGSDWSLGILSTLDGLNPTFDTWLRVMRHDCKRRVLAALTAALRSETTSEDGPEEIAEAILSLEPGNEMASEVRIRHAVETGRRTDALREFDRLTAYLGDVYGVIPGARVRAAAEMARSPAGDGASGADHAAKGAPPTPEGPLRRLLRIRVDRIESRGSAIPHSAQVFRTELIEALARFRDWSVLDGEGVANPGESPQQSDYRIALTAEDGKTAALAVSLTAVLDGRVIWQKHVTHNSEKWEELYRDLVRKITVEIDVYVSVDRLSSLVPQSKAARTSYDDWLRGDHAFHLWTPASSKEADRVFRAILAREPDNAPALASLASLANVQQIMSPGLVPDPRTLQEADQMARRALDQDPLDARVQRVVAWAAARTGAFARAAMHFDLAVDLHPNHPETLASCGMGFAWLGDRDKADALITRLQGLTRNLPEWQWCYLASTYFFLGRLDAALLAAELSADAIIDNPGWTAAIHARKGDLGAAGQAFGQLIAALEPVWVGPTLLTPQSAHDWFIGAYPIRSPQDVKLLSDALTAAMQAA